ncbi:glycosyltransferase [Nocardiopsis composta]|uniref:UDP-N-acetylglucosamine transferase subunit ALG13/GT2 family glycosyltransferase n=1 Tax=Nocardiopsis composta TaxID=157465 RepID=A0A7W8QRD0_9ACTN|nr:glycosyltransferase [Nocardiopsis composta]MBB5434478.1 UDP-N-acetylglucosamine transferase subunit ALG13/GT2 family glycosyltransferase [Nocardiopsis composta]
MTDIDDAPASAPAPAVRPAEAPDPRPLVLVTVGTDHHPFRRLVSWADAYAREHPGVRVLVQHGRTPRPAHAEAAEFLSPAELAGAMSEAAVVVTHGGPGSIVAARRAGHLPVAVARDPELGEHVDDHQLRFVTRLDTSELVRACSSPQQLAAALDRAVERPGEFRIGPEAGPLPEAAARRAGELIDLIAPPAREEHPPPAPVRLDSPDGPSGTDGTGWPEVTAIVPTRDRPDLVRRTLRSITGQDYPGVLRTIVVFDNDDPDHTLADDDPRRPVRVMANTRSPGLAGARNTGILAASGELVAFCDDDDTWLPGKLRRQVEVLLGAPETEIVCCGIRVIYERTEAERVLDRTSVTFADLLASRLTELHPSTFVIRRSALVDGCGTVDEELPGSYAEDYELLLRLARRAPVRTVPEAGVRVLWHRRSHFAGRWRTIATALGRLLEQYPEFRLVPRGHARVAGQVAFAEAAAGRRRAALRWTWTTLRSRPTEPRAYLALAVACGLRPEPVLRTLHTRGKGL